MPHHYADDLSALNEQLSVTLSMDTLTLLGGRADVRKTIREVYLVGALPILASLGLMWLLFLEDPHILYLLIPVVMIAAVVGSARFAVRRKHRNCFRLTPSVLHINALSVALEDVEEVRVRTDGISRFHWLEVQTDTAVISTNINADWRVGPSLVRVIRHHARQRRAALFQAGHDLDREALPPAALSALRTAG